MIAYPSRAHGRSIARSIAAPYLSGDQIELAMIYPVTTEESDHPGGYEAALSRVLRPVGRELSTHLDAGRDVAVLCEGDPMFYGSYIYLHERLAPRYPTVVVPGVTSLSAASAGAGRPLARRDEIFTVLPGTLPRDVLATRLATTDAAVVMKLGRTFAKVREAAEQAGVDAAASTSSGRARSASAWRSSARSTRPRCPTCRSCSCPG